MALHSERFRAIRVEAIDSQLELAKRDLADAKREINEHTLRLVDAPGDKKAADQIEVLEQEIVRGEAKIARLAWAKAEAERRNTVEFKRKLLAGLKEERAAIDERSERQKVLAREIVATIENLHPLLAEYEALGVDQHTAGWTIVRATTGNAVDGPTGASRYFDPIADLLRGAAARVAVINAAFASGLGRVGFRTEPWLEVRRVDGPELEEGMKKADQKIASTLDDLLAAHEATLGVK